MVAMAERLQVRVVAAAALTLGFNMVNVGRSDAAVPAVGFHQQVFLPDLLPFSPVPALFRVWALMLLAPALVEG